MIVFFQHAVHPGKIAFFNYVATHTKLPFMVYFLSEPANNRRWKASEFSMDFSYRQLSGWKLYVPGNDHSYFHFNFSVLQQLKEDQASMVLSFGWNYLATWLAWVYCLWHKLPFGIISESTAHEQSLQRTLTKPLVSLLLRSSQIVIGISTRAKEYCVALGASASKVKVMLSTSYQPSSLVSQEPAAALQLRKKLGIPTSAIVVLYVGQFIPRKGIDTLLSTAKNLQSEDIHFVLVGYGPMEPTIRSESKILPKLHLCPYTTAQEIWQYYFMSDIFVLASYEETWGLVVNEALEAGLPLILSKAVGSSDDLLLEGKNGFSFTPGDAEQLSLLVKNLATNTQLRQGMSKESKQLAQLATPATQIQVLLQEIQKYSV